MSERYYTAEEMARSLGLSLQEFIDLLNLMAEDQGMTPEEFSKSLVDSGLAKYLN